MFNSIIMMNGASRELELIADITELKTKQVKRHFKCFDNPLEMFVLKDETNAECLMMFSHIPTLKLEIKQQLKSWKQLFQLLHETNKQLSVHFGVFM